MPSKGKRAASRQAQLSQKKRKGDRQPAAQHRPQAPVAPQPQAPVVDRETPAPEPIKAPVAPRPATLERSSQLQMIRPYVIRELRRIGLLSGLVIVILMVLTVLLRG